MKAYLITTGLLFAALAALHVYSTWWCNEGPLWPPLPGLRLVIAGGMSVWAGRLLLKGRQQGIPD